MKQHARAVRFSFLATMLAAACAPPTMDVAEEAAVLPPCDPDNGGITLPDDFCAYVFADELGPARQLTVAPNGDVYVRLREREDGPDQIVALRDTTGDGRADAIERFADTRGTGIRVYNGYLYFSTKTDIRRLRLADDGLVPVGEEEIVVQGFPDQRGHAAKPFTFDDAGNLYVTIGAPSNNCMEEMRTPGSPGQDPCPELELQAGVWRYRAEELGRQHHTENRYSGGIRHAVALSWNSVNGGVYVVQHGRDQLDTLWPDLFTAEQNAETPSEEFLRLEAGKMFSWPFCFYDPTQNRRVLAPEYGGDGKEVGPCDEYPEALLHFPGHFAPNDLLFYSGRQFPERFRGGAFVGFHGSWNRAPLPQRGYKVAFVPFRGTVPEGDWEVFADNFKGVETLMSPGDARFRPMGLAEGPDGTLYVSDSVQGRIWRILHREE